MAAAVSSRTHLMTMTAARPWCARRPPRPPPVRRSVAPWEKDFCESLGVPWRKVTDPCVGLNADADGSVARWDDSAAVEALLAAKRRYWAEINGGLVAPPPPVPGLYCDDVIVDVPGGGAVDPELEAEYEAALRDMEMAWEENARLREAKLRDDFVPVPTGWDVDA
ncbi:unnamed protein product [Urochloa decumbens]|uniref:Uncharacterized protein n=1 Tax=Urochloa decumbens TaxID=240449 RepID=A0ABC8ZVZ4_9POAL